MTDAPQWNGKEYVPEEWRPLSGKYGLENMFTGELMPYQDTFQLMHEYEKHLPEERRRRIQIVRTNASKAKNFDNLEPMMLEVWRLLFPWEERCGAKDYDEIVEALKEHSLKCPASHRATYEGKTDQ